MPSLAKPSGGGNERTPQSAHVRTGGELLDERERLVQGSALRPRKWDGIVLLAPGLSARRRSGGFWVALDDSALTRDLPAYDRRRGPRRCAANEDYEPCRRPADIYVPRASFDRSRSETTNAVTASSDRRNHTVAAYPAIRAAKRSSLHEIRMSPTVQAFGLPKLLTICRTSKRLSKAFRTPRDG